MTVLDVCSYLEQKLGKFRSEEGLKLGDIHKEVGKIVVCFMADADAIEYAHTISADLIICHEVFQYEGYPSEGEKRDWAVNQKRRNLAEKYDIAVIRSHGSMDLYCILEEFALRLGLSKVIAEKGQFAKIYEFEHEIPFEELIEKVKDTFCLEHIRVCAVDEHRGIKRVGLPWGGMGLSSNMSFIEQVVSLGCDVLICGETDNYAMRFAAESKVNLIETSHEICENPGIERFVCDMQKDLRELSIEFFENKCPYIIK